MSGSDPGGLNWAAIFDSAHRRIVRRVLLVAGIGAAVAALLTSGGFVANGTIPLASHKSETTEEKTPKKPQREKQEPAHHQHQGPKARPAGQPKKPKKQKKSAKKKTTKLECGSEPKITDSASTEYEDCPAARIDTVWDREDKTGAEVEVEAKSSPPDSASSQK
jgi:hypothetical protein